MVQKITFRSKVAYDFCTYLSVSTFTVFYTLIAASYELNSDDTNLNTNRIFNSNFESDCLNAFSVSAVMISNKTACGVIQKNVGGL